MTEENFEPLSVRELAELDARYVPFPSFEDWPEEVPKEELWMRDLERFNAISGEAAEADLNRAQEIAMRTAAFDTGAIEGLYPTDRGLTFTVATQASAWEQAVEDRDSDALDLFKAQLSAFELILDLATDHFPKITQALVRRLHEEVTAAQETYVVYTPVGAQEQPLPKGEYKRHPNHVKTADGDIHAYSPVELTQAEMQRLLEELDTDAFQAAHPILQASYAHYALTAIHPFADGNGRVARAIASAYTYRAGSVPLLVLAHHRDQYFAALAKADSGNSAPFIEFIARAARDALEMVTETLKAAQAPQPDQLLNEFRDIYRAQGDLTHQQLDEIGNGFVETLLEIVADQLDSLSFPEGVSAEWVAGQGGNSSGTPEGFRPLVKPGPRYVQLEFSASPPAQAEVRLSLDIFVSTSSDTATTVMVQESQGDQLLLGLADLAPQLSSAARLRTESFVQRVLGNGLAWLLRKSRKSLGRAGY